MHSGLSHSLRVVYIYIYIHAKFIADVLGFEEEVFQETNGMARITMRRLYTTCEGH